MDGLPRSFPKPGHCYDLAIVGAGVSGCELSYLAARSGLDVLLVTQSLDSLGVLFSSVVDISFPEGTLFEKIRKRVSEQSDVPDMWGFHRALKQELESTSGIHLLQSMVTGLGETADAVDIQTWEGIPRRAKKAVVAVGSFLGSSLHIGRSVQSAGRLSEVSYDDLYRYFLEQGCVFEDREDGVSAEAGSLDYRVTYRVFSESEIDAFRLKRFDHTYALGRCLPGSSSYSQVLEQAHSIWRVLSGVKL